MGPPPPLTLTGNDGDSIEEEPLTQDTVTAGNARPSLAGFGLAAGGGSTARRESPSMGLGAEMQQAAAAGPKQGWGIQA
jgi:hypothetical protein